MPAKKCQILNHNGLQLNETEKLFLNGFLCLVDICPLSAVLMLHVCIVRKKGSRRGGSLKVIYPAAHILQFTALVFCHNTLDSLIGIQQVADRGIMVQGIDDIGDIFAHIAVDVPLALQQVGSLIN